MLLGSSIIPALHLQCRCKQTQHLDEACSLLAFLIIRALKRQAARLMFWLGHLQEPRHPHLAMVQRGNAGYGAANQLHEMVSQHLQNNPASFQMVCDFATLGLSRVRKNYWKTGMLDRALEPHGRVRRTK